MKYKDLKTTDNTENFYIVTSWVKRENNKSRRMVSIKCKTCDSTETLRLDHLRQARRCTSCKEILDKYESKALKRSYGERIVKEVLEQQGISFLMERSFKWSKGRRYDFILNDDKTIIEVHGVQHYEEQGVGQRFHNNLKNQKYIDKLKRDLAKEHGYRYIELDARKTKKPYFKPIIEKSGIPTDKVDWYKVYKNSYYISNSVEELIELYNSGLTLEEISDKTKFKKDTIASKIKHMSDIGIIEGHDEYEFLYRYCKKYIADVDNIRKG